MIVRLFFEAICNPLRFLCDLWETGGLSIVYDTCLQCETCGRKPANFDDMMDHIQEHKQATRC